MVSGILAVPALVVAVLIGTYVVVTTMFAVIRNPAPPPGTNPQVVALNDQEFNARIGRISSTDPEPLKVRDDKGAEVTKPGTAVAQPRLEYLREQAGDNKTDPNFYRSKRSMQERNSPEIRPEDLRPENYIDPATGQKILAEYGYVGDKNNKVIRVPIDVAIHMAADGKLKLPVRKEPVRPAETSDGGAKLSNGGAAPPAGGANPTQVTPHNEPGKPHKE